MEAVCKGKKWDVALALDGDRPQGAMPYLYGRRCGMTYILEPQLTQYSGPVFFYPEALSQSQRLEFEKSVSQKLIDAVGILKPAYFLQNFSPSVTNWLPFYWAGYKQTTRYTYRIPDIRDPQTVFAAFDPEKRQRKIRRYENTTAVRFDMSPRQFAQFHNEYWSGKGRKDELNADFIADVCSAAIERGNGVIASLHNAEGQLLSARFVLFDGQCAYSLMSAQNNALHKSGHSEMLFWELIKYLSDKTVVFDFEGSMDEGIEYFYRSFGAVQTPFFEISKCNSRLFALLLKLRQRR